MMKRSTLQQLSLAMLGAVLAVGCAAGGGGGGGRAPGDSSASTTGDADACAIALGERPSAWQCSLGGFAHG